ncbi:hypothetical protein IX324_003054 [Bacteroides pyogenes]|nr:hypothetical protein [Bacteroides pyogenes]
MWQGCLLRAGMNKWIKRLKSFNVISATLYEHYDETNFVL